MDFLRTVWAILTIGLLSGVAVQAAEMEVDPLDDDSVPHRIAAQHGVNAFHTIDWIRFTYKAQTSEGQAERRWMWFPESNKLSYMTDDDVFSYDRDVLKASTNAMVKRRQMDPQRLQKIKELERKFVNDKYWFFFPLHLVWDHEDTEITVSEEQQALPIGEGKATKVTVRYVPKVSATPTNQPMNGSETMKPEAGKAQGGKAQKEMAQGDMGLGDKAQPGKATEGTAKAKAGASKIDERHDVYELYIDENYRIKELVYLPDGNRDKAQPTKWQDYHGIGPFETALSHVGPKGGQEFRVEFEGVELKLKERPSASSFFY